MNVFTSVLEVVGLACLVVCAALIWWPAAFGVAGLSFLWLSRGITK